jgi:predicted nucleotidyltransferase
VEIARATESCENACMRPSEALAAGRDRVLQIAAARGARNLRVFGSVLRHLDREGSDLDLLVDLPPGTSLLRIVALQQDIEDALGVKVDLCTERELHPALKERILAEARPL